MSESLAGPISHQVEVKHSRFVANAAPVDTPQAALAFVESVSDADATHNCWAYRVGALYRSSDDGEPAGTAGRPILAAIDGHGIDQAVVVVTRRYGGIKLGAGGLVRAYGGAAAQCLRMAERRPLMDMCEIGLDCAFEDLGDVHDALAAQGCSKISENFGESGARLHVRLPAQCLDALKTQLRDATRNRVRCFELIDG